eukprot:CAMPEP_0197454824 /NCGR_PEP_ID=MMETSP1175-20131217/38986_1 /TAXON_ID=1003142 /ORGANISM="Triceratium dubium, Strain CCMP147" /LENGTH=360 /DNA_ID=CAMNT_0042988515 /DNA_START=118 /DNA_END=1200 /DNA_ORIENTATION=-
MEHSAGVYIQTVDGNGFLSWPGHTIVLELAFWALSFLLFSRKFSKVFRSRFKRHRYWYTAQKYSGVFARNAQDDLPTLAVVGIQHVVGGLLMTVGALRSDPHMWRHGLLCEAGYEIADLILMRLSLPPYDVSFKKELTVPIICHHIPGIVLSFAALLSNLHYNRHLRNVGVWLLLAGGLTLFGGFYTFTLDAQREIKKLAVTNVLTTGFFLYARFWAFPIESYYLISDVRTDPSHSSLTLYVLYLSATLYSLFNVGILVDVIPQTIRCTLRAFDGVTSIEKEPVPPPKEGRMKRRRSSIVRALDSLDMHQHARSKSVVEKSLENWEDTRQTGIFYPQSGLSAMLQDPKKQKQMIDLQRTK